MKKLLISALAIFCSASLYSQNRISVKSDADFTFTMWTNETAPHSSFETKDESRNKDGDLVFTSETVFYIYKAAPDKATGQGIVMLPGGGYHKLCLESKGFTTARVLRDMGITTLVVKYRLPNGHKEVPLEDAIQAMRYLREHAAEYGVDPAQVGICGESAGGHLGAYVSTFAPEEEKPAFAILFYPVITGTTWYTHQNTFRWLLGTNRTPAEQEYYSLENRVTETTPPTLLLLSDDDRVVPTHSSIVYYNALKEHGVKASLRIFPSGGHGWAGSKTFKYAADYEAAIEDWLKIIKTK